MIIGVAGPNAAGKGEVVRLLVDSGFEALSLSDAIREVLRSRGLAETRERMIETGQELRREGGPGVLAERLLASLAPAANYAIDSIRNPAEVEALRNADHTFLLLWVDADEQLRFDRMRARARPGDPETLEELRRLEGRELENPDPAGQRLLAVKAMADAEIDNRGEIERLAAALQALLDDGSE